MDSPSGYIKPDLQDLQLTDITAKELQVIAEAKMSQVKDASSWGSEDYPSLYDRHTRHMMSAHVHIQDALLLANLIPDSSIPSNKKLLDTACGTGALTFKATQLGIPEVTSTDFAQGMLDKLIKKAAQASPPIHVQTVLDDGQTLSKFEDASFDDLDDKTLFIMQPHLIKNLEVKFGAEIVNLNNYGTPGTPRFKIV
jgi:SAM-dependent methyltransferase